MSLEIPQYDDEVLKNNAEINFYRPYQQCSLSVMDTIADPNITFDEKGICNYYYEYETAENNFVLKGEKGKKKLNDEIERIKANKGKAKYDCIIGLSGGVDSTYLCLLAKEQGLNPLIVHCDNGWNSELAQHNIENTTQKCGFDLFTYVINWNDFRDLQLAYLKASVVDIEVLTDHAFLAVLYEQARKWKIKFVLAGMNIVTENVLPNYWIFNKRDDVNIKDIFKKNGNRKIGELKSFPFLNYNTKKYCDEILKLELITPLNWIEYKYDDVKKRIIDELNWRDYGGKHYESIWTRFYQGYILPNKFSIDKRKAHLSNLIFSKQITKDKAIKILAEDPIDSELVKQDFEYVYKKLGLTINEFEYLLKLPRVEHSNFKIETGLISKYPILKLIRPLYAFLRNKF